MKQSPSEEVKVLKESIKELKEIIRLDDGRVERWERYSEELESKLKELQVSNQEGLAKESQEDKLAVKPSREDYSEFSQEFLLEEILRKVQTIGKKDTLNQFNIEVKQR